MSPNINIPAWLILNTSTARSRDHVHKCARLVKHHLSSNYIHVFWDYGHHHRILLARTQFFGLGHISNPCQRSREPLPLTHLEIHPLWPRVIPSRVVKEEATHHSQQSQQPGQTQGYADHLRKPLRGEVDGTDSLEGGQEWKRRGFKQLASDIPKTKSK